MDLSVTQSATSVRIFRDTQPIVAMPQASHGFREERARHYREAQSLKANLECEMTSRPPRRKEFLRTDADTCDETTSKDVFVGTTMGGGLNDDTDAEDDRGDEHAQLAAESIGKDTISKYTNPSTKFKNRGDQTGDRGVVNAGDARGSCEAFHR